VVLLVSSIHVLHDFQERKLTLQPSIIVSPCNVFEKEIGIEAEEAEEEKLSLN
jgi:hypothetical protein